MGGGTLDNYGALNISQRYISSIRLDSLSRSLEPSLRHYTQLPLTRTCFSQLHCMQLVGCNRAYAKRDEDKAWRKLQCLASKNFELVARDEPFEVFRCRRSFPQLYLILRFFFLSQRLTSERIQRIERRERDTLFGLLAEIHEERDILACFHLNAAYSNSDLVLTEVGTEVRDRCR